MMDYSFRKSACARGCSSCNNCISPSSGNYESSRNYSSTDYNSISNKYDADLK